MADQLTARLKMTLPDFDGPAVETILNDNFAILDDLVPNTLRTRLTRPNSPFAGQKIYESDTGYERIWNAVSASWESLNVIRTTSVAARPVGAIVGDRLIDTDTGIERVWNGSLWAACNTSPTLYDTADATWPQSIATGAGTNTVNQLTVPLANYDRRLVIDNDIYGVLSQSTDTYDGQLVVAGTIVRRGRINGFTTGQSVHLGGQVLLAANAAALVITSVIARVVGVGTCTSSASVSYSNIRVAAYPV